LLVWATLFSSCFTNWAGLLDSFRTFISWWDNAGHQSPHAHGWDFYLERLFWFKSAQGLFWSEGFLFVLAIFAVRESFRRNPRMAAEAGLVRFLAFYTVLLAAIYAVIPYKTPWCALGFLHGLILLAGVGVSVLWRINGGLLPKLGVSVILTLGAAHLGWQAWRASFPLCADRANPWVYAQTSPDLLNLVEKVRSVALTGQGDATLIKVITAGGDCWPLPWYLRGFDHAGWWQDVPADPLAPMVIASAKLNLRLDAQGTHVMVGYFELRPQVFLELYVERGLWEQYLKR
jgi:predicted membrane-bound mannosyltransferase